MKELLDKLSSYNIFNYLFPGLLFCYMASLLTNYKLLLSDITIGVFLYYFVGMVVSRIGSIVLEPIFKTLKIVNYSNYSDFLKASQKDSKIELLSEVNNMYRSLVSAVICLGVLKTYEMLEQWSVFFVAIRFPILGAICLAMFVFSYRKQSQYINKRVDFSK